MANPGITTSVSPSFRDIAGRFTESTETLLKENRDRMRSLGRSWIKINRAEAPKGKTGNFARGINFKTSVDSKNQITFRGYYPEPLKTFISEGTRPHPIRAKRASALYFFWPKVGFITIVPKSPTFSTHVSGDILWIGKGYVDHPGTEPNPFDKRAFQKWYPEAERTVRQLAVNWVINATKT